jgi:acyl-CoA reductase-like NAD-dependent aldehyde dehydrogenase
LTTLILCVARMNTRTNTLTALISLKFRHAGQACITSNRIYVQRGVYDKFAQLLVESTKSLKIGHGIDKETTIGPVTTPAGLDKVASHVQDAKKHGATVLIGGERINTSQGYSFQPTIIREDLICSFLMRKPLGPFWQFSLSRQRLKQ